MWVRYEICGNLVLSLEYNGYEAKGLFVEVYTSSEKFGNPRYEFMHKKQVLEFIDQIDNAIECENRSFNLDKLYKYCIGMEEENADVLPA